MKSNKIGSYKRKKKLNKINQRGFKNNDVKRTVQFQMNYFYLQNKQTKKAQRKNKRI